MNGIPQTETIDRLFLELSQFATSKTGKEIKMENLLQEGYEALQKVRLFLAYAKPDADRAEVLMAVNSVLLKISNKT